MLFLCEVQSYFWKSWDSMEHAKNKQTNKKINQKIQFILYYIENTLLTQYLMFTLWMSCQVKSPLSM